MTSSPTTYARARLRLGMTGVGLFVVLATALLLGDLPERWLPTTALGERAELAWLGSLFGLYALLHAPLDALGGWLLPRRFGRRTPAAGAAVLRWLRGVLVQGVVVVGSASVMLSVARAAGPWAAWVAALGLMIVLVAFQAPLARLVGGFGGATEAPIGLGDRLSVAVGRRVPLRLWWAADEGFTGGWFGLPGVETLVLPARWVEELSRDELEAVVLHRAGALATGSRTRGLLLALGFTAGGLALASQLPGAGFATLAELARTALGSTLWTFLGLLFLPSASRPAVLAADAFARERGVLNGPLARAIRRLDGWQDDEPERPVVVETVFHPIPSAERRVASLAETKVPRGGAWHAARMMLFLSWAGLGLLARAVHCNAGRPQLWVALPAD